MTAGTLAQTLATLTAEGALYTQLADGSVRCFACGHRCLIRPGRRGICQVRFNTGGVLRVPWGYVGALQCDPTEKKPFYHLLPGSETLTFGMLGCNLHCPNCQNWVTSQALRDPAAERAGARPSAVTARQIVDLALRNGAQVVASSYNEPLITSEWAAAVFQEAAAAGLRCAYISSGNATPEALEFLRPYLTGFKIDLKTMSDRNYRRLGAAREHVLDTARRVHALGLWLEFVTLVIPGFNDSDAELRDAAQFIAALSPDIPWHVTAFHADYKMSGPEQRDTSARDLIRAAEIGLDAGLHYVYAGNRPGQVGEYEHTFCPICRTRLIERYGYVVLSYRLTAQGACPDCGAAIAGRWTDRPETVRLLGPGRPRRPSG